MRALSGAKFPDRPADPLIVHPDIRRMLLTQKAFAEGCRVLALYAYAQEDIAKRSADAAERERADAIVSFLTPIVKGLLTETAIECTYHALQIFGGHGYIVEHGMEQFARDARITTLYEGTTQIQALDLLGRKVLQLQGAGLKHFLLEISAFCETHAADAAHRRIHRSAGRRDEAMERFDDGNREACGGESRRDGRGSVRLSVLQRLRRLSRISGREAWLLLRHDAAFRDSEARTPRVSIIARMLPRVHTHAAAIRAGASTCSTYRTLRSVERLAPLPLAGERSSGDRAQCRTRLPPRLQDQPYRNRRPR